MSPLVLLLMTLLGATFAFHSRQLSIVTNSRTNKKIQLTKHNLVVGQGLFAGACAVAVFLYAAANIEEIKAKQKVVIEKAMNEQSVSIKSAQESQRLAIENAKKQQQEAISRGLRAAEEARNRK